MSSFTLEHLFGPMYTRKDNSAAIQEPAGMAREWDGLEGAMQALCVRLRSSESFIDTPDAWKVQRAKWIGRSNQSAATMTTTCDDLAAWDDLAGDMQTLIFERLVYEASDALNELDYYFAAYALILLSMTNKQTRLRATASLSKLVMVQFIGYVPREPRKATYVRSRLTYMAMATNNPLMWQYMYGVAGEYQDKKDTRMKHEVTTLRAIGFSGSLERIVYVLDHCRPCSVFEDIYEGLIMGKHDDIAWELLEYMKSCRPGIAHYFFLSRAIRYGRYELFVRLTDQAPVTPDDYHKMLSEAIHYGQTDVLRKLLREKQMYSLSAAARCFNIVPIDFSEARRDSLVFALMDVLTPDSYRNSVDIDRVDSLSIAVINRVVNEGIYKWLNPPIQERLLKICTEKGLSAPVNALCDVVSDPEKLFVDRLVHRCSLVTLDFYAYAGLFRRFETLAQACVDALWSRFLAMDNVYNSYAVMMSLCEMYGATLAKLPAIADAHNAIFMVDTYPRMVLALKHGFDMKVHVPVDHFRSLVCRYRDQDFAPFDKILAARAFALDVPFWEHAFAYVNPEVALRWMAQWHIGMKIPCPADALLAMAIQRNNYQLLIFIRQNMGVQVDEAMLRTAMQHSLGSRIPAAFTPSLPDLDFDGLVTLSAQIAEVDQWNIED